MAYRPNWRRVKINRSYTVDEVARLLGVCKATVRRWIKNKGLRILDDARPTLILGRDLVAFGRAQCKTKQKLQFTECFCMGCNKPRMAASDEAEIVNASTASANIRMQCETCSVIMHRRYAWRQMQTLVAVLHITAPQGLRDLIDTAQPCLNVHFEKDE